jgi:hypothetical protein
LLFQLHSNGTKLYNSDVSKLSTTSRKLSHGDKQFHDDDDGAQLHHNGASKLSTSGAQLICGASGLSTSGRQLRRGASQHSTNKWYETSVAIPTVRKLGMMQLSHVTGAT